MREVGFICFFVCLFVAISCIKNVDAERNRAYQQQHQLIEFESNNLLKTNIDVEPIQNKKNADFKKVQQTQQLDDKKYTEEFKTKLESAGKSLSGEIKLLKDALTSVSNDIKKYITTNQIEIAVAAAAGKIGEIKITGPKETLEILKKAVLTKDQLNNAKITTDEKLFTVEAKAIPGHVGAKLYGLSTKPTWSANPQGATLGACLQKRVALLFRRNDKIITTWHDRLNGNDNVGAVATDGTNHIIGKLTTPVHNGPDYDIVSLDDGYACDCAGVRASTRPGLAHFAAELQMRSDSGLNTLLSYTGANSGHQTAQALPNTYALLSDATGNYHEFIRTTITAVAGDSGGGLIFNGELVGILKGGMPGTKYDYFTPIWSVTIPAGYKVC